MQASAATSQANGPRQFVTFILDTETFGVEIERVQEIIGYQGFTKIPNQPDFMPGVLNLRGTVVPVVDLRLKFGMPPRSYDRYTVITILNVGPRTVGMVVDSVSDVITLTPEQIQPPPRFASRIKSNFIRSIGRQDDHFLILLDVDAILHEDELAMMDQAG